MHIVQSRTFSVRATNSYRPVPIAGKRKTFLFRRSQNSSTVCIIVYYLFINKFLCYVMWCDSCSFLLIF